ncbi:MAG: SBBP repeat-containing protein [Bacteroidetes bacterium]|nr:SBBP repeat-containing protein [Bacteroidota bacterium]
MKHLFISLCFLYKFASHAQPGFAWAKQMGGPGYDSAWGITTDSKNNAITTGYFGSTADFDPGPGIFTLTASGSSDIFISKLDVNGNFLWAKSLGGDTGDWGLSITSDRYDNIYVAGFFYRTADFDPGPSVFNMTAFGGNSGDAFLLKLDPAGNFVWAKQFGGNSSDRATALVVDTQGSIYIAGDFAGTADFDPGLNIYNLTSPGGYSNYVCKLDSIGNFIWAKNIVKYVSSGLDLWDMAVDSSFNIYTTGRFQGSADFDPGPNNYILTSKGNYDIYLNKLNSSGNLVWALAFGGNSFDSGYSLAVDRVGNIVFTGCFMDTVDFDPGIGTQTLVAMGVNDIFVSKLDSSGNFIWIKQMGGTSNDAGNALEIDLANNIYITGSFRSTNADFDPGAGTYLLNSVGFNDFYLCKLNTKGHFLCAGSMGGSGNGSGLNEGHSIAINKYGEIFIAGQYASYACDFDPTTSTYTLASPSSFNIFVTKLYDCGVTTKTNTDQVNENSVILFPNPSSGVFNIHFSGTQTKISIYDILGNFILNKSCMSDTNLTIDLSGQPKGIYILEIISEGQRTIKKVLVE